MSENYTLAEIDAMRPECPRCGSTNTRVPAVRDRNVGDPGDTYLMGRPECLECNDWPADAASPTNETGPPTDYGS